MCYLSFLHLGMSVVCLLVHLGFCFRFLILGVLFCVCLNLFFDVFYLRQLFYLRDVSATCDVFVSTCFYLSMSKRKLQSVGLFHG